MCCFSRPVTSVSATKIFARLAGGGRQFLAYSMVYQAKEDLAMVLPLPVPAGTAENAVQFIDLHGYPGFFDDLHNGFPEELSLDHTQPRRRGIPVAAAAPLAVVQVGSFEASFVPTPKDFSRLDARFRLPESAFAKQPAYSRFGFAVFKLKRTATSVHPMAFSFPSADPNHLFFPTVHIHDGELNSHAHFDHQLYCQLAGDPRRVADFRESPQLAKSFMRVADSGGLIDGAAHCYLRELAGTRKNADIYV